MFFFFKIFKSFSFIMKSVGLSCFSSIFLMFMFLEKQRRKKFLQFVSRRLFRFFESNRNPNSEVYVVEKYSRFQPVMVENSTTICCAHSVHIKLDLPQAAWLIIFLKKISSVAVAPPGGTRLRTHYWWDREAKKPSLPLCYNCCLPKNLDKLVTFGNGQIVQKVT